MSAVIGPTGRRNPYAAPAPLRAALEDTVNRAMLRWAWRFAYTLTAVILTVQAASTRLT